MSSDYKKSIGIKYNDGHIEYTLPNSLYGIETGSFYRCSFDTIKIGTPFFCYRDSYSIRPFGKINTEILDFRPMSSNKEYGTTISANGFIQNMFSFDSNINTVYLSNKNDNNLGAGSNQSNFINIENIVTPFTTPFASLSGFWRDLIKQLQELYGVLKIL